MKLEEIARLAGVSRTTASYVINGKAKQYRVSDQTIAKVMAIVNKYNFQPNAVAAGLRVGKTNTIGIIIPDLENNSYTKIANHLEQKVRESGYQLLISCSEDNPEIEKHCVLHLKQRHVDAIIVSSSFISDYSFYDQWDNDHIPILALDRPLNPAKFRSILGADLRDAQLLTTEFINYIGNSDIVYVGASPNLFISQLRKCGFRSCIKFVQNQITYLYAEDYSREAAHNLFNAWLQKNTIPKALFVTSFSLLQGVIDAILTKNHELPSCMVIATFGDNELLDFLPCNIISLVQDHKIIAEVTVNMLLNNLSNQGSYEPGYTEIKRKLNYRGRLNRDNNKIFPSAKM
ncbi:catabolite repressor/activator [Frischella sp. Ac48]|uniref:catabolite repressor/activator n=1 Tax=Frischella sp. Ac48 TaxID=2804531 RepID=UPI001C7DC4FB|nr:catabolite repressor/activator [Frischella sp. Ac48]MBX4132144.1 catabolite repressor/activator [Frischella sp. Ac48]